MPQDFGTGIPYYKNPFPRILLFLTIPPTFLLPFCFFFLIKPKQIISNLSLNLLLTQPNNGCHNHNHRFASSSSYSSSLIIYHTTFPATMSRMAFWSPTIPSVLIGLLSLLLLLRSATATATSIRLGIIRKPSLDVPVFHEAPAFRNGDACGSNKIHVSMTLDSNYLRGTMAAVLSILQHSTCPENVEFHFLWSHFEPDVFSCIKSTFPYLNFNVYRFDSNRVRGKISKSIRQALDQPLNYARIYLADLIPANVKRVIYLDSDLVVVDDIGKLWEVKLKNKVLAAPEYCHANFTKYFTDAFWSDKSLARTFDGRKPCYFNTGVMVVDVDKWRQGGYTLKMEGWMTVQKQKRIYHLGSLPPFLLVLAGDIKGVHHRWNQHGLGGDNLEGKCRSLHPGSISLLHWSGKGKPWLRLDSRKPCTVDYLWAPYDLYRSSTHSLEE